MDKSVDQSADYYRLVAWAHANRKQLIAIAVAVVVVAAGIGIYTWYKQNREDQANVALSAIKTPQPTRESPVPPPADPKAYLAVADQYSGTSAGARALLLGAGTLFETGKFADAQTQFGRFLSEYPDSPLADQASIGVAASLEAQGKNAEAASRYDDIIKHHPGASIIPQAKSALARLDVAQGKFADAAHLYEELMRTGNNDSWTAEAQDQLRELFAKHPELQPKPAAAPTASAPTIKMTPTPAKPTASTPAHPSAAKPAAPTT